MDKNVFEQFVDLFSYTMLASIFGTLLTTWLILVGLRWVINTLVHYNPKYRIKLSQIFPVLRVVLWFMAILYIIIIIIEPPQSVIYASLGSLGLAIGLASQDAARNLVAGIIMSISPRFKIGDMVKIDEHYGEVISLDLSTTKLHTFNDDVIIVPNADILKMPISNSNNGELNEMVPVDLHVPVSIPVARLKSIALSAAKCSHYVYLKKPIIATVFPVYEDGFYYKLKIKAYVLDVRFEKVMATDISERVIEALHSKNLFSDSVFFHKQPPEHPLEIKSHT